MFRRLMSGTTAVRAAASFLLVGGLGAVAACGGSSAADSGHDAAFHATVTDKFGTATITGKPVRVVAMSWTDADFALSLGVKPVGMADVTTAAGGVEPWTKTALGGEEPTLFGTADGDPIEKIAALKPDVILATKDYNMAQSYADLSKIAPVVTYVTGPNNDSWQQDFANVGTALGESARAKTVTAATEARIAKAKSANPGLAGKTFSYIVDPSASGAYTVNTTKDVSARLLGALGMSLSPADLRLPESSTPGRAQVSLENLGKLNADVVIAASDAPGLAALAANPVFKDMPAVKAGSYVPLDFNTASALAFPSPLSLDWAMSNVVPKLATAAARA